MNVEITNQNFSFKDTSAIALLHSFDATALNYNIDIKNIPKGSLKLECLVHKSSSKLREIVNNMAVSENKFGMLPIPLYPVAVLLKDENVEKSRSYDFDRL